VQSQSQRSCRVSTWLGVCRCHQPTSANLKLPGGGAAGATVGSPVRSTSLFAILNVVSVVELKSVQSDDRNGCVRLKPENNTTASEKKE
jgi:hypothetical protein